MTILSGKQKVLLFLIPCLFLVQAFVLINNPKEINIEIKPVFGKKKLVLEKENYITSLGDTLSVSRLRFYISSVQLIFGDGKIFNEKNSYHLIDVEEAETLKLKLKNIPEGKITNLKFNIGVDSTASVSGALDGDLDPIKGMYWAWNSGYINAKLEGKSNQCKTSHNEFEFHIGGYLSPNKTASNPTIVVLSDVAYWFNDISLQKNNSIVTPGSNAVKMADRYAKMFSIEE
jgi:hypothetical protein